MLSCFLLCFVIARLRFIRPPSLVVDNARFQLSLLTNTIIFSPKSSNTFDHHHTMLMKLHGSVTVAGHGVSFPLENQDHYAYGRLSRPSF